MSSEALAITAADVADSLRSIVITVLALEIEPAAITTETNLHEIGLESMNVVDLLMQIEMTFNVTIDVEDLSAELFARFGALVEFVQRKLDESH